MGKKNARRSPCVNRIKVALQPLGQILFPNSELFIKLSLDLTLPGRFPAIEARLDQGEFALCPARVDLGLEQLVFEAADLDAVILDDARVHLQLDFVGLDEHVDKGLARARETDLQFFQTTNARRVVRHIAWHAIVAFDKTHDAS